MYKMDVIMRKRGGDSMFRASGTSYSLRSPCVKLWRFLSHTFSEHSTMCLNTRTQRNRHEENAPAACILGFCGRDGLPWQRFKNSCLRFRAPLTGSVQMPEPQVCPKFVPTIFFRDSTQGGPKFVKNLLKK